MPSPYTAAELAQLDEVAARLVRDEEFAAKNRPNGYEFASDHELANSGEAPVTVRWHRLYKGIEAPWLLTVSLRPSAVGDMHAYPQSRAVMDDFGSLHCVREWM